MGLFDFIFSKMKTENKEKLDIGDSTPFRVSFIENFIEIPSLNFFGPFSKSDSGEWIICWSDSDEEDYRGGCRDGGLGRYVLCNSIKKTVVLEGRLERPNSGHVADNGSFSIEDWHFGNKLSGTFYVFSYTGQKLIERPFQANLYNSAISNSGRFAVCQTANAPSSADGDRFTAFDVNNGSELFSIHPPTGWAESYLFAEDASQFGVVLNKIGTFYYDKIGNLTDADHFNQARLHCERYDIALSAAEAIIKSDNLTDEHAYEALEACSKALRLGAENSEFWKAYALKIQGLAHEHLKNDEAALEAFHAALLINPKIGIKRKADALKKKLSSR